MQLLCLAYIPCWASKALCCRRVVLPRAIPLLSKCAAEEELICSSTGPDCFAYFSLRALYLIVPSIFYYNDLKNTPPRTIVFLRQRQAQDNHRSANEGEELRKRCERLLSSAQVTPTISAFDGPEGGAESPASIGSGDIVDQASMLSPSCAAESCWEGDSPEASPSPHMYRELVVLEGPPLSPLSHMLPELPEDVDVSWPGDYVGIVVCGIEVEL